MNDVINVIGGINIALLFDDFIIYLCYVINDICILTIS